MPNPIQPAQQPANSLSPASDGTRELLLAGSLILLFGLVCFLLLVTLLGGVNADGAHSNAGWLALIFAAMCVPFGLMLASLGIAKWLRKRPRH